MYQSQEKRARIVASVLRVYGNEPELLYQTGINGVCRGRLLIVYRIGVGISQ